MKIEPPKKRASILLKQHGIQDAKINLEQIWELLETEKDRNYWSQVREHLKELCELEIAKRKEAYSRWNARY
jgi:ankyrin repeat protein